MLSWSDDQSEILRRIKAHRSVFKVILKTKDDPFFLESWIQYHAKIVGYENIIVADNGSSDPDVLNVYRKFQDYITVFRFSGLHNAFHSAGIFPEFYAALSESTDFMQILDGDERIVFVDEGRWHSGPLIVDFLRNIDPTCFVLGIWPPNIPHSESQFVFAPRDQILKQLLWGKSVFPTKQSWPYDQRLHNCQHDIDQVKLSQSSGWFVLHLKNLNFENRLFGIRQKLIARGAIHGNETDEELLMGVPLPGAMAEPGVQFYFSEFKKYYLSLQSGAKPNWIAKRDTIELREDGVILFHSEETKTLFDEYRANVVPMFLESYNVWKSSI